MDELGVSGEGRARIQRDLCSNVSDTDGFNKLA